MFYADNTYPVSKGFHKKLRGMDRVTLLKNMFSKSKLVFEKIDEK